MEPGQALVLVSPEDFVPAVRNDLAPGGTWSFLLEPIDERTTRLVVTLRDRAEALAVTHY